MDSLFRSILISFAPFLFLLEISKILDLASLKPNLFLFDHAFILFISMFAKFSASLTDSPLMINRRSSANAIAVVRLVKLSFCIVILYVPETRTATRDLGAPFTYLSLDPVAVGSQIS